MRYPGKVLSVLLGVADKDVTTSSEADYRTRLDDNRRKAPRGISSVGRTIRVSRCAKRCHLLLHERYGFREDGKADQHDNSDNKG